MQIYFLAYHQIWQKRLYVNIDNFAMITTKVMLIKIYLRLNLAI